MDKCRTDELLECLKQSYRVEVDSVDEAIFFANELKNRGEYDLFRGQTNATWRVTPSLSRATKIEHSTTIERIGRLQNFLQNTPGLESYSDVNSLIAIAQHYGIPTNYVDFTSDPCVAGYFSSDLRECEPQAGQNACIIALNSSNFTKFWFEDGFGRDWVPGCKHYPEIIKVNVANLWRLQSQSGCFIWMPFDVEQHYRFEKIIFPFSKPTINVLPREHIYPTNQSPLEQQLNLYFLNEQLIEGNRNIERLFSGRVNIVELPHESNTNSEDFIEHPSWLGTENWIKLNEEHSSDSLSGFYVLPLPEETKFVDYATHLISQFTIEVICANRSKAFHLNNYPIMKEEGKKLAYVECLKRLWNGMRVLPYSDAQIHKAMIQLTELFAGGFWYDYKSSYGNAKPHPTAREVEFGRRPAYSRAFLKEQTLQKLITPEFKQYCADEFTDLLQLNPYFCLTKVESVRFKFEFNTFVEAFAQELIPTQLAMSISGNQVQDLKIGIFYSPARLDFFGIP